MNLTVDEILADEQRSIQITARINEGIYRREVDSGQHRRALADFHGFVACYAFLWLSESLDAIVAGDRSMIEAALTYLEADPFCFRSGYLRERVIRRIKRAPLRIEDLARVRRILVAIVDRRDRRDFRDFCRLARIVRPPGLELDLGPRLESFDKSKARRARWMLEYLAE